MSEFEPRFKTNATDVLLWCGSGAMKKYRTHNRHLWDRWAELHRDSEYYDVAGFVRGSSALKSLELREVGPVHGKRLLHLQCHFGLDTLSWVREGAQATGIDYSETAVRMATELARQVGLDATFVHSDVYDLPRSVSSPFDIAFTSYGILPWLHDLDSWAEVIAGHLKPGGLFYMVEFHPVTFSLDDKGERFRYPYFQTDAPLIFGADGSFAVHDATQTHHSYEWPHSLGEVVTALIDAGLIIEHLHEFPYSTHPFPPYLTCDGPERYILPDNSGCLPLMFSVKARKPLN